GSQVHGDGRKRSQGALRSAREGIGVAGGAEFGGGRRSGTPLCRVRAEQGAGIEGGVPSAALQVEDEQGIQRLPSLRRIAASAQGMLDGRRIRRDIQNLRQGRYFREAHRVPARLLPETRRSRIGCLSL